MQINDIKTIGIAGSGVMGAGIANVFASAGYNVIIFDINLASLKKAEKEISAFLQKAVEKGKMNEDEQDAITQRIVYVSNLDNLIADLILEAVVEKLEVKHDLFTKLEAINSDKTIFATNTSSLPVTQIAACLKNPNRCVGMHFFNPAQLMKLVEVIPGVKTDETILNTIVELTRQIGKVPAVVKDSPGFIVNRVARHYYLESLKLYEEGVADVETIDILLENAGFKMGAFKLMDLIGVETNHEVTKSLYNAFYQETRFRPSRIQQKKVEAGEFGRKTGKGFYNY